MLNVSALLDSSSCIGSRGKHLQGRLPTSEYEATLASRRLELANQIEAYKTKAVALRAQAIERALADLRDGTHREPTPVVSTAVSVSVSVGG